MSRRAERLPAKSTSVQTAEESELADDDVVLECPHCGSDQLELIGQTPKPSWKALFWRESETCPQWYAQQQRDSHRRFWTAAYGSDFYDWYLETQVEGAKETEPESRQPLQLYFAEMVPQASFLVDSY